MNIPHPSENLQKLIEKIKKKKSEAFTHQFNLLDELHANENAHTRILVRLLQIPSLLHSFLVYLNESFSVLALDIPDNLSPSDVTEFSDYIDAKIETENFCIIIENKINNAVDQHRQIERYVTSVQSASKKVVVLYLTLDGTKEPDGNSIGESKAQIIKINYKEHILYWLEHKITFSVSDSFLQPFLQSGILQYIDHIKGRLGTRPNDCDKLLNDIKACLQDADIFDVIAELQYLKAYWRIYFTRNIPDKKMWGDLPDELKTEILFDLCGQLFAVNRTTDNRNCFLYEGDVFSLEAVTASKISLIQIDVHYSGNRSGIDSYNNAIEQIKSNNLPPYITFDYNGASCLRLTINTPKELKEIFTILQIHLKNNFNLTQTETNIPDCVKDFSIFSELENHLNVLAEQINTKYEDVFLALENGKVTKNYRYNNGRAVQLTHKAWKQPYAIDIWGNDKGDFTIKLIQWLAEEDKIYPYSCRWWNGKFYLHFPLLSLTDDYAKDIAQKLYKIYQNGFESESLN